MPKKPRGVRQTYVRAPNTAMTPADLSAIMPGKADRIVLPNSQCNDDGTLCRKSCRIRPPHAR